MLIYGQSLLMIGFLLSLTSYNRHQIDLMQSLQITG